MDSMHTAETRGPSVKGITSHALARAARIGLVVSAVMLAGAAVVAGDGYSIVSNTISESGAQGSANPWVMRGGVLLTALSMFALTSRAPTWSQGAKRWLRAYAASLVMLALFPESPWTGASHNEAIATLHTVFGVAATVAFVFGAMAVSRSRPEEAHGARLVDWVVIVSVVVIPQVMLLASAYDGLLQRFAVLLGYIWLLLEANRIVKATGQDSSAL